MRFFRTWRATHSHLGLVLLTLGFMALSISLTLKNSSDHFISTRAREILTADIQISSTRPIAPAELSQAEDYFRPEKTTQELEWLANVRGESGAALAEIKAVDANFPLVGQVRLVGGARANFQDLKEDQVFLAEELKARLGLSQVGEKIRVGRAEFHIAGWIEADVGLSRGATGFAPRLYLRRDQVERTGLVQVGSQVQYRWSAIGLDPKVMSENANPEVALAPWPDELILRRPADSVQGIRRGLTFVERFFGLATLMVALMSFVTSFFLLQISLRKLAGALAIMLLSGATWRRLYALVAGLIFMEIALALAMALVGTIALVPIANRLFAGSLPFGFTFVTSFSTLEPALIFALGLGLIMLVPFVLSVARLEPLILLESSSPDLPQAKGLLSLWPYTLAALWFSGLTAYLLDSWRMAVGVSLVIGVSILLFATLIPRLFQSLAGSGLKVRSPLRRLGWLNLARPRLTHSLLALAVVWCAVVAALLPNLFFVARQELTTPDRRELPNLFLINILSEDVRRLVSHTEQEGAQLRHLSPLIQGRLMKVNGHPPLNDRLERFPVRLSFREKLSSSETLVAGTPLPARWNSPEPAPVSIEVEFAERSQLKIGDDLEFEVAGLPVLAKIANLREVRWSSFQPNFFIQFPAGVIDDFPQSLIAVVYGVPGDDVYGFQGRLMDQFPNLTSINLATTIDRLSELSQKLLLPILAVTVLTLVAILLLGVTLSVLQYQQREDERQLLVRLGALTRQIRSISLWEVGSLVVVSVVLGFLLGNLLSLDASRRIFGKLAPPLWQWQVITVIGLITLGWIMARFSSDRSQNA